MAAILKDTLKFKQLNELSHGDLFHHEGLQKLDQAFLAFLQEKDPALAESLLAYRFNTRNFSTLEKGKVPLRDGCFAASSGRTVLFFSWIDPLHFKMRAEVNAGFENYQ